MKILTQAVRPPVPSLKDIQEAMRAQEIGACLFLGGHESVMRVS